MSLPLILLFLSVSRNDYHVRITEEGDGTCSLCTIYSFFFSLSLLLQMKIFTEVL